VFATGQGYPPAFQLDSIPLTVEINNLNVIRKQAKLAREYVFSTCIPFDLTH